MQAKEAAMQANPSGGCGIAWVWVWGWGCMCVRSNGLDVSLYVVACVIGR